jgi:hypothetical protein
VQPLGRWHKRARRSDASSAMTRYDPDKLKELTAAGDAEKLAAYAKQVGEPTGFGVFYELDMGSMMRLAEMQSSQNFISLGTRPPGGSFSVIPELQA